MFLAFLMHFTCGNLVLLSQYRFISSHTKKQSEGRHSLTDLTERIKTRIDDSHAPPGDRYFILIKDCTLSSGN